MMSLNFQRNQLFFYKIVSFVFLKIYVREIQTSSILSLFSNHDSCYFILTENKLSPEIHYHLKILNTSAVIVISENMPYKKRIMAQIVSDLR